jgi:SAM-dependent methyltransferase
MSYAEIAFEDRNPVKRWLQRRRLESAVRLSRDLPPPSVVCDFGAGNGELCKLLARRYPGARIICYEPIPDLMEEARRNVGSLPQVAFHSDLGGIERRSVDVVFCLEVFEHLPASETRDALLQIDALLAPQGTAVIGVPAEIGPPALYKGCFRICRRFGEYDANPRHILRSFLGRPPADRPTVEIAPGFRFHYHHLGFDHRCLREQLGGRFEMLGESASPFAALGAWLNPEVYFVVRKADPASDAHGRRGVSASPRPPTGLLRQGSRTVAPVVTRDSSARCAPAASFSANVCRGSLTILPARTRSNISAAIAVRSARFATWVTSVGRVA